MSLLLEEPEMTKRKVWITLMGIFVGLKDIYKIILVWQTNVIQIN